MDTPVGGDVTVVEKQTPSSKSLLGLLRQKKFVIIILLIILIPLVIFLSLQKQPTKVTQGPAATPTPTLEALLAHQAKQDMPIFLQTVLKTDYIPSPQNASDIQITKNTKGTIIDPMRFNIITTIAPKIGLAASIRYVSKNTLDERRVEISMINTFPPLSSNTAETYANSVFNIKPRGEWKCNSSIIDSKKHIVCENFWSIKDLVKMGIYLISPEESTTNEKNTILLFCEYYQGGNYFKNTSCKSP